MADLLEERRCTAKSKRSGERCKRAAVIGGRVCAMHGGSAPQTKAAAEQRELERKAAQSIERLWPTLAEATPVKDPVAQMEQLAGALSTWLDTVGAKVRELDHLAGGTGLTQLRGEFVLLDKLSGHLRLLLADMARHGIAERHVELEQERAQLVSSAFLAALGVVSLLPADRDAMLRAFLSGIGRGPEVLEQGGGA